MANIYSVTKVVEQPSKIFITDKLDYLGAREQADQWAQETGLSIATMPQLAEALRSPGARKVIRTQWADVDSAEYHGMQDGEKVYAVAHGTGPFSKTEHLIKGWDSIGKFGFMAIEDDEWQGLLKNAIHLSDLKNGAATGERYVVFVRLDKDKPNILPSGDYELDDVDKKYSFMNDDIALMRSGSLEARQAIAEMILLDRCCVMGNSHRINEVGFGIPAIGRSLFLYNGAGSELGGDIYRASRGRFIGVDVGNTNPQDKPLEKRV